jgi:hypothetical protein
MYLRCVDTSWSSILHDVIQNELKCEPKCGRRHCGRKFELASAGTWAQNSPPGTIHIINLCQNGILGWIKRRWAHAGCGLGPIEGLPPCNHETRPAHVQRSAVVTIVDGKAHIAGERTDIPESQRNATVNLSAPDGVQQLTKAIINQL